jgi:type IV pilus assembly protein PilV
MRPIRRTRARGERAFTLIEVMIALAILATGLLAVAAAQLYAMKGGRQGRHSTDAAEIAQAQLENFQRMSWTDPDLGATGGWQPHPTVPALPRVVVTEDGAVVEQTYNIEVRVTNVSTSLKSIDVRVTWDEPERPGRSYTITTMRHNESPS